MKIPAIQYLYRKIINKIMIVLIVVFSLLAVAPFFYIMYYVFQRGFQAIDFNLFTQLPGSPTDSGGGLANGIIGSMKMVGLACLFGIPWGIFLGICLSEYRQFPISKILRFVINLSVNTPSIVIGIFIYTCMVVYFGFSAYAGAMSLLMILVPIVACSSEEILKLIPSHIREAGLAIGIPKWKVIMQILIPGTFTMLFSGVILAIARVAGETAPLLFTALGNQYFSQTLSEPTASLPVQIYEFAKSGFPNLEAIAWGGSLLLIVFVFLINFLTRLIIFISSSYKDEGLSGGH